MPQIIRAAALLIFLLLSACDTSNAPSLSASNQAVQQAFEQQQSKHWLEAQGTVEKVLADDNKGSRHQRFILRIAPKHTVLIAHNIDLAPRLPLTIGAQVKLRGRYEWNNKGGVIHWTHHDPKGRKVGGWIELNGQRYR